MLERSRQGHIEADIEHAYVNANFNRGRCVLQRLKRRDNDFQSSIGIQAEGRASPVLLVASSMSSFRSPAHILLGGQTRHQPHLRPSS
jgi:hypothetical protein